MQVNKEVHEILKEKNIEEKDDYEVVKPKGELKDRQN